jgi:hypothetical protein
MNSENDEYDGQIMGYAGINSSAKSKWEIGDLISPDLRF